MKRFQFKLQAVLTLRLRAEHEALSNYAQTIQASRVARAGLTESEMELCEARRRWLTAMADGLPAARASQMRTHNHWLEERKQQCEQALRLAEISVEEASRRMVVARQQREAVEKHHANQRELYDRAVAGEERRFLDDLAPPKSPLETGEENASAAASPETRTRFQA